MTTIPPTMAAPHRDGGDPGLHPGPECQLADFPPLLERGPPSREEPWSWYLARRARGLGLRLRRTWNRLAGRVPTHAPARPATEATELQAGDRVRIRSAEEIRATLDAMGRLSGCGFTAQMYAFCGREARVARRVERFFDEARSRMLRSHRMVLLEGVYCDGSHLRETQGCDRMCFLFWRTEWLEKLEPGA